MTDGDVVAITLSTHVIHVDGDHADSFCNGGWRLIRMAAEGDPLWDGSGRYDDALLRTADGWRISRRACRITWWTGNPSVNAPIPGVKFDLTTSVLRREGAADHVGILTTTTD